MNGLTAAAVATAERDAHPVVTCHETLVSASKQQRTLLSKTRFNDKCGDHFHVPPNDERPMMHVAVLSRLLLIALRRNL
jgi:hypothetical protein